MPVLKGNLALVHLLCEHIFSIRVLLLSFEFFTIQSLLVTVCNKTKIIAAACLSVLVLTFLNTERVLSSA